MMFRLLILHGAAVLFATGGLAAGAPDPERGARLYKTHCAHCHQPDGGGQPAVFPPLRESDFIRDHREKSILAVLEGMQGEVAVNGATYNNAMPPAVIPDRDVADVLTFVFTQFGNKGNPVTSGEVEELRQNTKYPTYKKLVASFYDKPLPPAPEGFELSVLADMDRSPLRMAELDETRLLVLQSGGDLIAIDKKSGASTLFAASGSYVSGDPEDSSASGLCITSDRRVFVVGGSTLYSEDKKKILRHDITIYRSAPMKGGEETVQLDPWFETIRVPVGKLAFNHSPSCIVEGPDGYLYVGSGSRTDSGYATRGKGGTAEGERGITSCIWRLSKEAPLRFEVFAEGFRNPFGLCFDSQGNLYASENGPDREAPEELNRVEWGRNYGFPHQFADFEKNPYPESQPAPKGSELTLPMQNMGPAGLGHQKAPLSSFANHSSPAGMTWLDDNFPEPWNNGLLVTRFGNLIKVEKGDVGFDVLFVKSLPGGNDRERFECQTFLAPLARPIDVLATGAGEIYIAEFTRSLTLEEGLGLPGRILVLRPLSK